MQIPFAVRETCGHFLNNSISHEIACTTRLGVNLSHNLKWSGGILGGSFSYLRNNISLDYSTRRFSSLGGAHFRFSARGGYISSPEVMESVTQFPGELLRMVSSMFQAKSWQQTVLTSSLPILDRNLPFNRQHGTRSTQNGSILPSDQFLLGGSTDLRGFRLHSVGPQHSTFAAGANTYWALGAHTYIPPPAGPWRHRFGNMLNLHAFFTAGSAASESSFLTNMQKLTSDVSASCGLGVALDFQHASLELNYCLPLRVGSAVPSPGFSFAIGANLL